LVRTIHNRGATGHGYAKGQNGPKINRFHYFPPDRRPLAECWS
jgi:hypothetical protein